MWLLFTNQALTLEGIEVHQGLTRVCTVQCNLLLASKATDVAVADMPAAW